MEVEQMQHCEIRNKHRVERAIIMAAGTGTRMRPVTLDTPKPLIRVNGVRMIDTVIRALQENGIFEIYVVTGYQKEQFACLTENYEGVQLIENPYWASCNNIASLYVAREHLENAMILDGDQMVYKKEILAPEFTRSGYNEYLRAAGKDLESFRNRLKETHLPEELQSKAETFLVQTVHALDVTEKKQMYRRELIGMEEKVKETAEQIEELLKSMRELGV